jgi:ArsR family transcriptional regulator
MTTNTKLVQINAGMPEACCNLDISGEEQDRLVQMFKAIGNPVRMEILKFLLTHPGCITGDIVEYLPISQSTVSQHLKVLKESGWIQGNIQGPATNYCLDGDSCSWFREKTRAIF